MVYDGEGNGGVGLEFVDVFGNGLIKYSRAFALLRAETLFRPYGSPFISIGSLDNVVHVADVFCGEDANEIAGVANWLYIVEHGDRTDHCIGWAEMLPLHEGAYLLIDSRASLAYP